MKVKHLIAKLQKLGQNDEVMFGGITDYIEPLKSVQVRRVYDNDTKNGERRVVLLNGFDYGDAETFEIINE